MPKSKVRDVPEINAGSMADIAFLLLIFFIVATTMDVDSGISTKLPPMPENEQEPPPPLKERNVFQVLVNANNQILVEGEWSDISKLKDEAKEFINNNGKKDNLSENPEKAVISLQNDRGTSYDMYIQVQNELKRAYNELRNEASQDKFGRKFNDLPADQQREIQKMYPMKISEAEPKNIGGL
ncbi:MAG: biopolymer transporter ExbD [Bacteroidia bacterium]|nr:biopolymer transporter ExbD [Bacteroidia bacterium]MCZ2277944.1 biopolymer transporter ExbD [Bacteroidia bacterium]